MNRGSIKRRLLRRTPILSRLARTIDTLEQENEALQSQLAPVLLSKQAPAPTELDTDGIPIPPAHLRFWVAGKDDLDWFLKAGKLGADTVTSVVARHGLDVDRMGAILDFGCGCGRVIRHLRHLSRVRLHGTDVNPQAIAWCDEHLDFAEFSTNRLEPPTRYRAGSFDLIYAFSVFTHLTEPVQTAWMAELRRILTPTGRLIISLHGECYLPHISEAARAQFSRGQIVVLGEEAEGENRCAAFHPETYVRTTLAQGFDVVDFIAEGALGNPRQDLYLLQRRP